LVETVLPSSNRPSKAAAILPTSGNFLRHDGPAGTVVFLVALPLCLGIALASGAPLFAGIISGVLGGLLVSVLSGSQVSVAGPAAGLAVIVASAIRDLGSFQAFLTAVVLAGILQILFGLFRAGFIADYIPNPVIKGMLAGIGLAIIFKQIPHALGRDKDFEGDLAFLEAGGHNTLTDIVESVLSASPGAVTIALVSLVLLVFWEKMAARGNRFFALMPGALVVVVLGIVLNEFLGVVSPGWKLTETEHLVQLPISSSAAQFFGNLTFPDFSVIGNQKVWTTAFTLAAIASIETLLSLEAADRLDPYLRISPPNRELFAQGFANIMAGLIGGLPVTSVIVRTSANVYAGARTKMASFIHGALLLSATLFIPGLLNKLPLCSLAAILILVGYKLTKADLYKQMYRQGVAQFLPFIVTVVAIVFSDLLLGVLIGMVFGFFFVIRNNHHAAVTVVSQDNLYLMRFNKDASFVNKSEVRSKLRAIPAGANVVIDGSRSLYIDRDIYEVVEDFQKMAPYKDIQVELKHFSHKTAKGRF
jgi:MFS superfamily sulfate permease-like transporter